MDVGKESGMTVEELIDMLKQFEPRTEVLVNQHSDYALATTVSPMQGKDHGGWVSHPYSPADKLRAKNYVWIG